MFFLIISLNFVIALTWVIDDIFKHEKKKNAKKSVHKGNSNEIGKDAEEFLNENYEDMIEMLRSRGFTNIVAKAEKKGILDTEGVIKGISVSGNTEFSENDEFDLESKILIRYYSKQI